MTTMEKPRKFYDYEEYLKSMNLKKANSSGRVSQSQISSANSTPPVSPPPGQTSQTRPSGPSFSSVSASPSSPSSHPSQPKSNRANLAVFNVSSETSSLVQLPNPQHRYHPNGTTVSSATVLHHQRQQQQRQAEKSEFAPAYLNPPAQRPPPPPAVPSTVDDGLASRTDFTIASELPPAPTQLPHQPSSGIASSGSGGGASAGTNSSTTSTTASSINSKPKTQPNSNNRPAPLQLHNNTRKSAATIARSATTVLPKKVSITRLNSSASDSKFPLTAEIVDPSSRGGAGNSSSSELDHHHNQQQPHNQEWLLKDLTAFRDRELYKLHQHKASFLPIPPRSPSRTLFNPPSSSSNPQDTNFIFTNQHYYSRGPTTSIFKEGSETPPSSSRAQSPSPTTFNLTRNNSVVTANMSIYSSATTNKTADHAVDQVIQSFIIDELSVFDNFGQVSGTKPSKSTPETDVSLEQQQQQQQQQHATVHDPDEPRSMHFYNDKRTSSIYSVRNTESKLPVSPSSSSARSHLDGDPHMATSSPVTSVEATNPSSAALQSSSSSYRLARSKSQYLSGTKQRKISGFGGRLRSLLHKNKEQDDVKPEELEKTPVIEMKFASER